MSDASAPLVLHVIHHLVTGGMENGLVSLINHMPATAFRHAIVCIEDYSDFRLRLARPDTPVFALHRSHIGVWRTRRELFGIVRRLKPAIVHSRNQSGLDALLPARLAGVRHCVHGEHGWDVHDLDGSNAKQMMLRRIHSPLVARYITVSRGLKDYLVHRVHVRPERITTICNGVDTEKFRPREGEPTAGVPDAFAGEGLIVFGTVGRLQPVKDQESLLRAFAKLVNQNERWRSVARLFIVGGGPLAKHLQDLAQSLDIEGSTWFAGDRADVAALLQRFDVFVLPSLNEGISNTVLEAMATGLPILATRVGGNVELVQDGVNGRLHAGRDVETLAAMLGDYLSDPAMRRRHGEQSRRLALAQFSLAKMVGHYQATYQSLMAAG